jgi:hypothetical protein
MKHAGRILGLAALVVAIGLPMSSSSRVVFSEESACSQIVLEAFSATDEGCEGTGRNQACYGHIELSAEPQTGVETFKFNAEGDIVDVLDMQSLRLSPMDTERGLFGTALMRLQASLPSTTAKNITLLLFGEVELENTVEPAHVLEMTVRTTNSINVRLLPSTEANTVAAVYPGDTLTATGRLEDSSWVRVQIADNRTGWVFASLLTTEGDLDTLSVVDTSSIYYTPMQAFYFRSGMDDAACAEAPNSGMLIQTPEGVGSVTFLINEVSIQLGSTIFFEAAPGGEMTVSAVEGSAVVTAAGVSYRATAGTEVAVPMDEDMKPAGPPSEPRPYKEDKVRALPLGLLERTVEIHAPLTEDELADYLATPEATGAAGGGWETAPGLGGDTPPGQGGDYPPGQGGGYPPGQSDKEEKPPKDK